MTEEQRRAHIAALIEERENYERQGKEERVAAVDEQLRAYGYEGGRPSKRAEQRPAKASETR